MALTITTQPVEACTLEECLAAIDAAGFTPHDPRSVVHGAEWLARLAANRDFLGDLALARLQQSGGRPAGQGYTPQVLMLGTARPGWFMRANIWPSAQEAVTRESGETAFVYGLAHDHNFDFLTVGYHGPGYRSDHYEVDPGSIVGRTGEKVGLRFVGTSVLHPGRVMHYRARRDVHCQYAPQSLSVSINLMHSTPDQRWRDQFQYDIARGVITRVLTGCTGETLARLALALEPCDGRDRLEEMASRHPQERLRWSAIVALAQAAPDAGTRAEILARHAARSTDWLARRCLAEIGD
ncbi:transposase [Blastomonas sp.]|uniref:transposase n=1 Tax=Blastomonas sp. TaxID=1909299 RepID=UPI002621D3C9|nr:transposase [Blastomonas sp.]MDM7956755.1 transposase [Blastomonas sp.]